MERFPPIEYPGNVPGILYEPRVIWSVESVDTAVQPNGRVTFPRNDFQNPGKYPIVLTKLLLAPVNYTYAEADPGVSPPTTPAEYHVDAVSALGASSILINAPQRQNYSRRVIPLTSWAAQPRWEPSSRNVDDGTGVEVNYRSSLWGATRWDFDHTMIIPRLGTLEIQLSPFNVSVFDPLNLRDVFFTIGVNEGPPPGSHAPGAAGVFPGNMRVHPRSLLAIANGFSPIRTSGQGGTGLPLQSQQRQITDVFGAVAYAPGIGTSNQWPPTQQLSAREYDAQNVTEMGSTPVNGFAVQIDQIDYDDVTVNQFGVLALAGAPDQPISPLAMRVATRARMRNGGSGEYWWRPGAPLGLVQPTMTPALVYHLPQPITLAPGDTLDVELQVQRPITIAGTPIAPAYNVGLSFCGYAAIEG